MSSRTLLERATQGVLDKLAREAGGCFAPEGFSFGGCDDASPCWCRRRARELARVAVEDDWLPIDTAPPGRDPVDLWVIPPTIIEGPYRNQNSIAGRYAGARRSYGHCNSWSWHGKIITGRWYFDEEGETCLDPNDKSERAFRATHWRPVPGPPSP